MDRLGPSGGYRADLVPSTESAIRALRCCGRPSSVHAAVAEHRVMWFGPAPLAGATIHARPRWRRPTALEDQPTRPATLALAPGSHRCPKPDRGLAQARLRTAAVPFPLHGPRDRVRHRPRPGPAGA